MTCANTSIEVLFPMSEMQLIMLCWEGVTASEQLQPVCCSLLMVELLSLHVNDN